MRQLSICFILILTVSFLFNCKKAETLANKADGIITGNVLAGIAGNSSGQIYVVASFTSDQDQTDWSKNSVTLKTFDQYKIQELVGGKYYLMLHLDSNRNHIRDLKEFWGGYDANGDGRLDPVALAGGETLTIDLSFFDIY